MPKAGPFVPVPWAIDTGRPRQPDAETLGERIRSRKAATASALSTENILRRAAAAGEISADVAALAHADLLDLRVEPGSRS